MYILWALNRTNRKFESFNNSLLGNNMHILNKTILIMNSLISRIYLFMIFITKLLRGCYLTKWQNMIITYTCDIVWFTENLHKHITYLTIYWSTNEHSHPFLSFVFITCKIISSSTHPINISWMLIICITYILYKIMQINNKSICTRIPWLICV